jgi:formate hydrogenlyase transcriptional activator
MDALVGYSWPGNIRELQNLIERAVILSSGPTLEVPALRAPADRRAVAPRAPAVTPASASPAPGENGARRDEPETLEHIDRRHIINALERSNWVIAGPGGAAARLGMKRSTLQFRMRKLGIVRPVQQQ